MGCPRLRILAGVSLLVLAGLGGCAKKDPPGTPRKVKDLGPWQGGTLSMMVVERSPRDVQFFVSWSSGGPAFTMGGPWRNIELVRDTAAGELVLVVGERGRLHLQVWKGPRGPYSMKSIGLKEDLEAELGRLSLGPPR
jgi:hypothetical protein